MRESAACSRGSGVGAVEMSVGLTGVTISIGGLASIVELQARQQHETSDDPDPDQ